jgi:hypothetical protein
MDDRMNYYLKSLLFISFLIPFKGVASFDEGGDQRLSHSHAFKQKQSSGDSQEQSVFRHCPKEIMHEVASYFDDFKDLVNFAVTCKRHKAVFKEVIEEGAQLYANDEVILKMLKPAVIVKMAHGQLLNSLIFSFDPNFSIFINGQKTFSYKFEGDMGLDNVDETYERYVLALQTLLNRVNVKAIEIEDNMGFPQRAALLLPTLASQKKVESLRIGIHEGNEVKPQINACLNAMLINRCPLQKLDIVHFIIDSASINRFERLPHSLVQLSCNELEIAKTVKVERILKTIEKHLAHLHFEFFSVDRFYLDRFHASAKNALEDTMSADAALEEAFSEKSDLEGKASAERALENAFSEKSALENAIQLWPEKFKTTDGNPKFSAFHKSVKLL